MAKRSPILGYNHNVRYRGLVFHVQTEDSGVLSPRLFTHLFHTGVIVSTRKLVYDSGLAEESIKSLMQAQHKAVLKDLKRGVFDDKIDEYLGSTPGLLPRGAEDPGADPRASEPQLARASDPHVPIAETGDPSAPVAIEPEGRAVAVPAAAAFDPASLTTEPIPRIDLELESSPVAVPPPEMSPTPTPAPLLPPRVQTAERKSAPGAVRLTPPESTAAVEPRQQQPIPMGVVEAVTAAVTTPTPVPLDEDGDSGPEIEIQLELDEPDEAPAAVRPPGRNRTPRDTDLALPPSMQHLDEHNRPTIDVSQLSDGVPGMIGQVLATAERARTSGDAIPPVPALPEKRPSTAVGAASLPPARPITRPPARPPALTPPAIVARPLVTEDSRGNRRESDGVEVYSPPPGGEQGERPGVYSQHKKGVSQRIPSDIVGRPPVDRGTGVPIPPGLGRPGRPPSVPSPRPATAEPPPRPSAQRGDSARAEQLRAEQLRAEQLRAEAGARVEAARAEAAREALRAESAKTTLDARSQIVETMRDSAAPREIRQETRPRVGPVAATPPEMPARARTPTPTRASSGSGPTHSRAGTGNMPAGGGVVMTRPAVIVGAPTKPANPPRVRRAREDEGRGFGQGLISEKSLDEVILAYLSEDSEDK